MPLDPFVVNLADKDTERYAQIGISMQVGDAHLADEMKAYMPAIKDSIILILSHKTSEELLSLDGKQKMAEEIQRAAARAMGYDIEEPEEEAPEDEHATKKKKKKKKRKNVNSGTKSAWKKPGAPMLHTARELRIPPLKIFPSRLTSQAS